MSDTSEDMEAGSCFIDDGQVSAILVVRKLVAETPKAYLIKLKSGVEHWFPKSQCDFNKDRMCIEVPQWLLESKGIY